MLLEASPAFLFQPESINVTQNVNLKRIDLRIMNAYNKVIQKGDLIISDNVIHLPRSREARPTEARLGMYLRVGRNQHKDLLETLGRGERNFHGLVIDAHNADRHSELITQALQYGLDVALDPRTLAMAFPGGHNTGMASLPWGLDRPHNITDFEGNLGRIHSIEIAEFATKHGFTQVLGPSHLLGGANDPWLRRDIENVRHLREALDSSNSSVQVIYPVALPMKSIRDPEQRSAIVSALADAPMDMIWLRIENFGADASGEKTIAYIQAARDFHSLGVPIIADHVGGVTGLGLLAFGAVGGIAHGITLLENFQAAHWRRARRENDRPMAPAPRVYIPQLDLHLKREDAEAFLRSSPRVQGLYSCRDSHCCSGGLRDMLSHPTNHFVHQRSIQIAEISGTPDALKPSQYLERNVRPISDDLTAVTGLKAIPDAIGKKLEKRQSEISKFRQSIGHFARTDSRETENLLPLKRGQRSSGK